MGHVKVNLIMLWFYLHYGQNRIYTDISCILLPLWATSYLLTLTVSWFLYGQIPVAIFSIRVFFDGHRWFRVLQGKGGDELYSYHHGTIIQTGITKLLVICATQLAGGLFLKMLKYFEVMLNIFEFSSVKGILESWLVYC